MPDAFVIALFASFSATAYSIPSMFGFYFP